MPLREGKQILDRVQPQAGKMSRGVLVFVECRHCVQYIPMVEDMVLGIVTEKTPDCYKVDIHSYSPAILPNLAFEGASKRNRPHLEVRIMPNASARSLPTGSTGWHGGVRASGRGRQRHGHRAVVPQPRQQQELGHAGSCLRRARRPSSNNPLPYYS